MKFSKSGAPFRAWALGQGQEAGGYNAPGLPEIAGAFRQLSYSGFTASGSFYDAGNGTTTNIGGAGGYTLTTFGFKASRSNATYGTSATVMPSSINIPVILYLGRPK
jgi:hypothetical protein